MGNKYFSTDDEILQLVDWLEERIESYEYEHDLTCTKTLAKCFVLTIHQIIRAIHASASIGCLVPCNIMGRSLMDYVVDMAYIVRSDSHKLNSEFANYYKLKRYFDRNMIDYLRDDLPRVKEEFREYVLDVHSEKLPNSDQFLSGTDTVQLAEMEKAVGSYKRDWDGKMDFRHKVIGLSLNEFAKLSIDKTQQVWNRKDGNLRKRNPDEYSNLSFVQQVTRVIQQFKTDFDIESDARKSGVGSFLQIAMKSYKYLSSFTHSSCYSVIPHHNLKDKSFSLKYSYTSVSFSDIERLCLFTLIAVADIFSDSLSGDEAHSLKKQFWGKFASMPKTSDLFGIPELLASHAARSRDK